MTNPTTTRISIFHGFEDRLGPEYGETMVPGFRLRDGWVPADGYRMAYTYTTALDAPFDSLDLIYRDNQMVDGWERPAEHEARSLSVGDVVVIAVDGVRPQAFAVMPFGFAPVESAEVLSRMVK